MAKIKRLLVMLLAAALLAGLAGDAAQAAEEEVWDGHFTLKVYGVAADVWVDLPSAGKVKLGDPNLHVGEPPYADVSACVAEWPDLSTMSYDGREYQLIDHVKNIAKPGNYFTVAWDRVYAVDADGEPGGSYWRVEGTAKIFTDVEFAPVFLYVSTPEQPEAAQPAGYVMTPFLPRYSLDALPPGTDVSDVMLGGIVSCLELAQTAVERGCERFAGVAVELGGVEWGRLTVGEARGVKIWRLNGAIPTHTVTFAAGGDGPLWTETVAANTPVAPPAEPERGFPYVFDGWYLADAPYDFSAPVTADITLTAHWRVDIKADDPDPDMGVKTYGVTYQWSGEPPAEAALPAGGLYTQDTAVPLPEIPAVYGYSFRGWRVAGADGAAIPAEGGFFQMPAGDVTVTGEWSREPAPDSGRDSGGGGEPAPGREVGGSADGSAEPDLGKEVGGSDESDPGREDGGSGEPDPGGDADGGADSGEADLDSGGDKSEPGIDAGGSGEPDLNNGGELDDVPDTGDNGAAALWAVLALFSGLGLAAQLAAGRQKRN